MRVWAKRTYTYNGEELEIGQIFELIGARLDPKLITMGHCAEVKDNMEVWNCTCGKSFFSERSKQLHQTGKFHPKEPIVLTPEKPRGRPKVKV